MAPLPEPDNSQPNEPEKLTNQAGPQVLQVSSDSDSDYEEDIRDGYVPLAQGPETALEETESESEDSSQESSESVSRIQMAPETAEQIKAVMAKIKLPNIPLWARQVPEEQWMNSLMKNIHKDKTEDNNSQLAAQSSESEQEGMGQPFVTNFEAHFSDS
ncbi:uncharacterized protein [Watersipora subatra]|uniref:uncharacterized protein n=1 Tax=Watersipora subatra TaxID=2589382 RepID=UPI00355BE3D1